VADDRLGAMLLQAGVLTPERLENAERIKMRTGVRLGQILVDNGWVDENALYDALSQVSGTPRLDMQNVEVDRQAIRFVDSIWALDHGMVPLSVDVTHKTLVLAVTDPTNLGPLDELSFRSGLRIRPLLGSEAEIGRLIRHQFFEEPLDREEENVSFPIDAVPDEGGITHGMTGVLEDLARRSGPRTPHQHRASSVAERDLLAQLKPVFEGHQENARMLQAIFELCVQRGIITRDEYLRRLAADDD
jgi:hypothetical protein